MRPQRNTRAQPQNPRRPTLTAPPLSLSRPPHNKNPQNQHPHTNTPQQVRVVTERAYHALFMHNMLIRPTDAELESYGAPDFTIYNAGAFPANRFANNVTSSTCVAINLRSREMVILGTEYAGEMKKGVFSVMHYLMPKRGILSLHSGCNVGAAGDVTLFFGLSGARCLLVLGVLLCGGGWVAMFPCYSVCVCVCALLGGGGLVFFSARARSARARSKRSHTPPVNTPPRLAHTKQTPAPTPTPRTPK